MLRKNERPRRDATPVRVEETDLATIPRRSNGSGAFDHLIGEFHENLQPLFSAITSRYAIGLGTGCGFERTWTVDASACIECCKENNRLAFKQDADLHAGGLIVKGKQITGTFQKCTVKSLHDDGPNVRVIASCSDGVAVSDVAFDVKISGENSFTLSSKEPVPVEMPYVRCSM